MKSSGLLLSLLALPLATQAQLFTFGVKGGMPAQIPLQETDSRVPFVVGPTVDVRLFWRVSIETGLMFQRMGQQSTNGTYFYPENALTQVYSTQSTHALDIPILAKVRLLSQLRKWQPFVALGPTVRRTSFESSYRSTIFISTQLVTLGPQPELGLKTVNWSVDPALGAGVDFKTGRFHLEPEVRYSYWGAGTNLPIRKNQVDFLFGLRF
jgi:hypothetical protein